MRAHLRESSISFLTRSFLFAQVLLDDVAEYLRDSAAAAPPAAQQQHYAQQHHAPPPPPAFDAAGRQLIAFAPPVPAGCRGALKAFLDHITARLCPCHARVVPMHVRAAMHDAALTHTFLRAGSGE
jgi:hypothetical protein